ncbi:chromosome partitioning protein ParB [Enterococcus casseliflavus]|nr:chromosome partitioning protein ParB [Enterococcus casseliflavus]
MEVKLVPITQIEANDYNPNQVAKPELDLLEHSIREDGITQPIVCYYDSKNDNYIIVDGFHRYFTIKERLKLEYIPVVTIDKPLNQRMSSTIRHNRARGLHEIDQMGEIVKSLSQNGWDDIKISQELGMELEEVFRYKQTLGLRELFINHQFSQSWTSFEEKYFSENL